MLSYQIDIEVSGQHAIMETHQPDSSVSDRIDQLSRIKIGVSNLDENEHANILLLIYKKAPGMINENTNGCFVNISALPDECLCDIDRYIEFTRIKNTVVTDVEEQMDALEGRYFRK
jgi:hypothetical protein